MTRDTTAIIRTESPGFGRDMKLGDDLGAAVEMSDKRRAVYTAPYTVLGRYTTDTPRMLPPAGPRVIVTKIRSLFALSQPLEAVNPLQIVHHAHAVFVATMSH